MPSLDVIETDPAFSLAQWGSHVVVVWRETPDVPHAQRVANLTKARAKQAPGKACHFAWVLPTAGTADAATRGVFAQMGRDLGKDLACMLAVVGDDGFASAAFRAVITGIAIAARIQFPLKLAATLGEGASWVEKKTAVSAVDLTKAMNDLAAHRPRQTG